MSAPLVYDAICRSSISIFQTQNQSITQNAVSTKIEYNKQRFKKGNKLEFDITHNAIKCKKTGLVYINIKTNIRSGAQSGQWIYINLRKNNGQTLAKFSNCIGSGSSAQHLIHSAIVNVNENDYIYVEIINYSSNQIIIGYEETTDTFQCNELSALYI